MSVARRPQLGSKPVELTVKLKKTIEPEGSPLSKGLQDLYRRGELADIVLLCAEQRFPAHRAVLASRSRYFREGLASQPLPGPGMRSEVRLDVPNPEAVKIMLDYLYELDEGDWASFNPATQEINRDVLKLAAQLEVPGLTKQATYWLSRHLTTGNIVERLAICDEFGLYELSQKILEQLNYNKAALAEVAHSQQIMSYPQLMQKILQCAAGPSGDTGPETPQKTKKHALTDAQNTKSKKVRKA